MDRNGNSSRRMVQEDARRQTVTAAVIPFPGAIRGETIASEQVDALIARLAQVLEQKSPSTPLGRLRQIIVRNWPH